MTQHLEPAQPSADQLWGVTLRNYTCGTFICSTGTTAQFAFPSSRKCLIYNNSSYASSASSRSYTVQKLQPRQVGRAQVTHFHVATEVLLGAEALPAAETDKGALAGVHGQKVPV